MPSNKLQRINDDIRRVMSDLLREIKDPRVAQGLISVVSVDTSSDLGHCTVFVSIFGENVSEKEFKKGVRSASGWLRRELSSRLSLRHTPELSFVLDDSISHGARINEIINSLGITNDSDEQEPENDDN